MAWQRTRSRSASTQVCAPAPHASVVDLTSERPAVSAHVGAKDKELQARRGG